ncbi:MAG TPA: NAD(P)H-hydrate epimerase, partial [Verrucomicrobiae bacterium]|nr:NAD(P)H-hydrate epimerase [Verrucomicrobiae bacterium]
MIYVLDPAQMREADAAACASVGEQALMHAAGTQIAERLRETASRGARIVAFAGPGNNGGDAFAALAELGAEFRCIVYAAPAPQPSAARAAAEARAREAGVLTRPLPQSDETAREALEGSVAVDGLFGTGARLPMPQAYRPLARALDARRHPVLAIDIPSGVDA